MKPTHGGNRAGSGRKKAEPTEVICFRVNSKLKQKVMKELNGEVGKLFNEWFSKLVKE
jgi:hypothetical protein